VHFFAAEIAEWYFFANHEILIGGNVHAATVASIGQSKDRFHALLCCVSNMHGLIKKPLN